MNDNVSLVLSNKAAKILDAAIDIAVDEQFHFSPESDILTAIQKELHDQGASSKPKIKKPVKKPKIKNRK